MAAQASPIPFQPYRKVQVGVERDMRLILESTAKAIAARIAKLPVGIGGDVRKAQLIVTLAAIKRMQQSMWTGGVNPTLATAVTDAEKAAESAIETMTRVAYASLPDGAAEALTRGLRLAAEAGLKADAARRVRELSSRVYRQAALHEGKVEELIRQGLISGLSARELAATVHDYISPSTPGGASYAAMRLARTEINNAFHERQLEGAKRPGVTAVKWNLSGSHRVPDLCNVYAAHNKGTGEWPVGAVPDKPHPQCFCYLTYITASPDEFQKRLAAGSFDDEIDKRTKANLERLGQPVGGVAPKKATAKKAAPRKRTTPAKRAAPEPVDVQIGKAIQSLSTKQGELVNLARLRDKLSKIDRTELDRELLAMDRRREIQLEPDPNRQALSQRTKDAAIPLGGEDMHLVVLLKEPKSNVVPIRKSLADRVKGGIKSEKTLSGGAVAKTDLVTLKDGTKAVRKVVGDEYRDSGEQQDAEELASLLAKELNVTAPSVYRPEFDTVYMDYMDGQVAITKWDTYDGAIVGVNKLSKVDPEFRRNAIKTGLLDIVIVNTDRNPGNWLLNGSDIVAIDHGMAFGELPKEVDPGGLDMIDAVISNNPFTPLFIEEPDNFGDLMGQSEQFSQADLDHIEKALKKLLPEFKRVGQEGWYHLAIGRIDFLRHYAKGKGTVFKP